MEKRWLKCQFVFVSMVGGPCTAHPAGDSTNLSLRVISKLPGEKLRG